ncbi:divergent PAP2 family protein [Treponema phagedenis]|uniref:Divergent PAP2 family protein n=2 Tax=Treponema phagedenis TaxID=162 RepID=A0AAE6IW69_TREPH|nr:divergent PAP2 family protein [Treponema phagedenis]QEJ94170.1 divergent PAP2 family protein [Treponema phagedenis]QEJ99243.1 divergent PAP2 family protein [Treponema phagedenis]QEK00129.1 divergent PAP2 family protein [Treponema phagedenis]QEK04810.1 divergent PAP2 family protein [Treponema phagedenis]QEK07624.1 divergent PAP2 family protein [Treponema phagedenis]
MNKHDMMVQMINLANNPIFLSAVCSWFFCQVVKTIIAFWKSTISSKQDFLHLVLWQTGGMPSSHSALVSSLATSIGIKEGIDSTIFIFAFFSSIIVIRDALGVRRSNGVQAKVLNELGMEIRKEFDLPFTTVKEIHGHKPLEVLIGILAGAVISIIFCSEIAGR